MTERDIEAMHAKPVLVTTQAGIPVSLGRIRVSQPLKGAAGPRVEILFETESMCCALGVPLERMAILRASFDGEQYRHRLPEGDSVWLPAAASSLQKPATTSPFSVVETFPLPAKARLVGPADEFHRKDKGANGIGR